MPEKVLHYTMKDPIEVNLSYIPFMSNGGLFVPTQEKFVLEEEVIIYLTLPGKKDLLTFEGKVAWITPPNALHHVITGIGVHFTGSQAATIRSYIESCLNPKMDIGGYVYGITSEGKEIK